MEKISFVLSIMMMILTACGSGATTAATLDSGEQAGTAEASAASSAPIFTSTLAASLTPAPTATDQPTATLTALPTLTNTPTSTPTSTATAIPVDLVWYWTIQGENDQVMAVNQLGEVRVFDSLTLTGAETIRIYPLDAVRGLLFVLAAGNASAYLLTPESMQTIDLGESKAMAVSEDLIYSLDIVAWAERYAVLSFITQTSRSRTPDNGPIFLIDLKTLTTAPLDEKVSRAISGSAHSWFYDSPDGRYIRYLSGDKILLKVRELDLETGQSRTLAETTGSPYDAFASPAGDMWYLENSHLIIDVEGRQVPYDDSKLTFRPLGEGKGLVFYKTCNDNCPIRVFLPFDGQDGPAYRLPWGLLDWTYDRDANRLLSDQSLLVVGSPYLSLEGEQALLSAYPALKPTDNPIFRLTPDGQGELLGVYDKLDPFVMPVSPDGRYLVLLDAEKTNYFLYDTQTGERLFEIPLNPALDYEYFTATYMERGVILDLVSRDPSDPTNRRQDLYVAYNYSLGTLYTWEDPEGSLVNCQGLEMDDTLICWNFRNDNSMFCDIVRFDLYNDSTKTVLLENVWLIYYY